jgi:hypothetical protein
MHVLCKTAVLTAIVSTIACHDAAGPPPLPADFVLDNINGRQLPTYWSPIPESPTIISSTLHLDGAGNATLTEHRLQMTAPGDFTVTSTYTYTISGNQISFGYNCPPNAQCVAPPHGTISGANLSLDMSGGSGAVVYNYLLTSRID